MATPQIVFKKEALMETENSSVIAWVWVGERDRLQMTTKELLGVRDHGNILEPDSGDGSTTRKLH